MTNVQVDRDTLLYQLGRESVDEWANEQDELAMLEFWGLQGDGDMVQYTLGRLSTLPGYDSESEVS